MEIYKPDPSVTPDDRTPEIKLWTAVLCTYVTDSEWIHPDSVRGKVMLRCLSNKWTEDMCDMVGIDADRFRKILKERLEETKRVQPEVLHLHRSMRRYDFFAVILSIGFLISRGI